MFLFLERAVYDTKFRLNQTSRINLVIRLIDFFSLWLVVPHVVG